MELIYALDMAGTFVFAISGTITAAEKRFDPFGAAVIALVTAVGGGTVRDLLIGATPVGWLKDNNYLLLIVLAVMVTWLMKSFILRLRRTMFLFDTVGIGLFTIMGLQKTLDAGLSPAVAIVMGTVSAVFGGVVRDTLCNEIPLIFRREIYATACLAGGGLYFALREMALSNEAAIVVAIGFVILIRSLAVRYHWSLPALS